MGPSNRVASQAGVKRRRPGAGRPGPGAQIKRSKRAKKVRQQAEYHSSESEDEQEQGEAVVGVDASIAENRQRSSLPKASSSKRAERSASDDDGDVEMDGEKSQSHPGNADVDFHSVPQKHEHTNDRAPQASKAATQSEQKSKMLVKLKSQSKMSSSALQGGISSDDENKDLEGPADDGSSDSEADSSGSDYYSGSDNDDGEDEDLDRSTKHLNLSSSRTLKKRHDPTVFATSMTKILSSKLTAAKRADPILTRSAAAARASTAREDSRLESQARHKLSAERRALLDRGRIKDVLGLDSTETSTAGIQEREKKLRRLAQRGVIKLFNAVRAAQVKGEQAEKMVKSSGLVGVADREDKVREMSKQGFLDLISAGADIPVAK